MPWGVVFTDPFARGQRRHAAQRASAPDAALRVGRRAADPGRPALVREEAAGRSPAARSGATCWSTRISRFIIEFFRGDPRGMALRRAVDVAVHLDRARAAQPRDALAAVAPARARARAMRRAAKRRSEGRAASYAPPARVSSSVTIVIGDEHHGQRLDQALAALVPQQSRSQIQRLIKDGGSPSTASAATRASQPVDHRAGRWRSTCRSRRRPRRSRRSCRSTSSTRTPTSSSSTRRAGVVVHPAAGHADGTLVNALLHHVVRSERRRRRAAARASCIGSTRARRG